MLLENVAAVKIEALALVMELKSSSSLLVTVALLEEPLPLVMEVMVVEQDALLVGKVESLEDQNQF